MDMYVTQVTTCSKYNLKRFHLSLRTTELTKPTMTMYMYLYLKIYTCTYGKWLVYVYHSHVCMHVYVPSFACFVVLLSGLVTLGLDFNSFDLK